MLANILIYFNIKCKISREIIVEHTRSKGGNCFFWLFTNYLHSGIVLSLGPTIKGRMAIMSDNGKILEILTQVQANVLQICNVTSQLHSDVVLLRNDVSQLQSDFVQLRSDVSQLQSDVSQLRNDVSQLQNDVSQLRSDVSQLQSDVSSLKQEQEITNQRLGSLEQCQITMQADIAIMKGEISDIKYQQSNDTEMLEIIIGQTAKLTETQTIHELKFERLKAAVV